MAVAILIAVSFLYAVNFFLLSHEYLKVPIVRNLQIELESLDHSRTDGFQAYLRELQNLESQRLKAVEKLNWKEEGF